VTSVGDYWKRILFLGTLLAAGLVSASSLLFVADRAATIPAPSDVIVALAGAPDRGPYAASLVARGFAPVMYSSLVNPACIRAGQSPRRCPSGVRNTVDEALLMCRALPQAGVRRATIVTSQFHLRRTAAVFQIACLGNGMEVEVVAPPESSSSEILLSRERQKLLPSIGAAVLGKLSPGFYLWVTQPTQREPQSPQLVSQLTSSLLDIPPFL